MVDQYANLGDGIDMETTFVAFEHLDDTYQRGNEQHQKNQILVRVDLGEHVHRILHGLGKIFSHG